MEISHDGLGTRESSRQAGRAVLTSPAVIARLNQSLAGQPLQNAK